MEANFYPHSTRKHEGKKHLGQTILEYNGFSVYMCIVLKGGNQKNPLVQTESWQHKEETECSYSISDVDIIHMKCMPVVKRLSEGTVSTLSRSQMQTLHE